MGTLNHLYYHQQQSCLTYATTTTRPRSGTSWPTLRARVSITLPSVATARTKQTNQTTTLGDSGRSSPSSTVVEDTELVVTVALPPHHRPQSTKLKTRPSRLHMKTMRLAHPSPVAHHLPSQRVPTQVLTDMAPNLHSQKATTHTTDMVLTTDELAAVAAADVEAHGVAAANSDHL